MPANPLVSVILPVFNGEAFLAQAIASVLAQTYRPIQVIVVDDGSTDATAAMAQAFQKVEYVYQANQGLSAARNAGIHLSSGEFIAFLDADDLWLPDKLRVQIDYLLNHPEVGYAFTQERLFTDSGSALLARYRPELVAEDHPGYHPGTLLIRRAVFEQIGLFDPAYKITQDTDWFARAKDAGICAAVIPQTLLLKRVHGSNLSSEREVLTRELLRVLRSSIERQRAQRLNTDEH